MSPTSLERAPSIFTCRAISSGEGEARVRVETAGAVGVCVCWFGKVLEILAERKGGREGGREGEREKGEVGAYLKQVS